MPAESRTHGFPSSMRTSSYHINDVLGIKQSKKTPSSFKLLVVKDGNLNKRYDLEADSGKVATEIVSIIKDLFVPPPPVLTERENEERELMKVSRVFLE